MGRVEHVPPNARVTDHSGLGYSAPCVIPQQKDMTRAAEVLNAGQEVAILAGAGALNAGDELLEVAELLGAGIAKALLGKAVLPDALPFVTGQMGLLGSEPSGWMMRHCDTLLTVGARCPYPAFHPR